MTNPFRVLADQMGLSADALAARFGIPLSDVSECLSEDLTSDLAAVVTMLEGLRAKMRVEAGAPLRLWIANGAIDRLFRDQAWRKDVGLCPLPRSSRELTDLITVLRDRGESHQDIANYLQRHFVPTGGGRKWTPEMVGQRLSRERPARGRQVRFAHDEWRRNFRSYVASSFLARMFPPDPMAAVRYAIGQEHTERFVVLEAKKRIPLVVREWMDETISAVGWFGSGEWGFGSP